MSWLPGFSAPWSAWLFALLVPLIIFYFLKLKRPRLEIASLALWRQVISDQRVNSPFQKFKRNLLLLLQILVLCFLALAAMQPFIKGNEDRAQYLPIIIDSSASMGAIDEASGKSRLDLAKAEIRQIIEGLLPGQEITLIAANNTARRLTEFTDNEVELLAALDGIEVTDVPTKLEDALQVSQALTKTVAIEKVLLYSDGNIPTRPGPGGAPVAIIDFDLSFDLEFHQISAAGRNIGITACNARRAAVDRWDIFVRVESGKTAGGAGEVQLFSDGQPLDDPSPVSLEPGASQRLVFSVDASQPQFIEARLTADGHDALASDNAAFLDLPVGRELIVFCPPDMATYRHLLENLEGVVVEPDVEGNTKVASFDLVISNQLSDETRESTAYLFSGVIPQDLSAMVKVDLGLTDVVDWKRDAPLLQHVQLRDVQVADLIHRAEGVEDGDFEQLGYELLAFGRDGPLIVQRRSGAKLFTYLLFGPERSTLPYRVGFPILVQNAVNMALQQASLSELKAVNTGILPAVALEKKTSYRIAGPRSTAIDRATNDEGVLDGVPAPYVGRYDVRDGGRVVRSFGASLVNPSESSLAGVDELQFKEVPVAAEEEKQKTDKPLWSTLALVAFAILMIEWWFYQKKPAGIPN